MESEVLENSEGSCRISGVDRVKQSSLVAQTDLSLREDMILSSQAQNLRILEGDRLLQH